MRRGWVLGSMICAVSGAAHAQPADVAAAAEEPGDLPAPQTIVYGAMPGGLHVASAETLPAGAGQVSMLSGLGRRSGLLGAAEKFNRAIGDIAFAYGITEILSVGLSLDGRYDKHWGIPKSGDDGYVGDPHLMVRLGKLVGPNRFGAQVGVWVPGKNAPSIAGSATSVDARGIATIAAGPAQLSLDVGFRLDRSIKSAPMYTQYSLQDQVSLGVSDFNAVLAGAQAVIPAGKAFVALEASLESYIGTAPTGHGSLDDGKLLIRGAAVGGLHINNDWSAIAFLELAKGPGITDAQLLSGVIPIVPYEPSFTGGVGIEARFGGPKRGERPVELDCHKHTPPDCVDKIYARITGITVLDTADKPVVGAKVKLTLKNFQMPACTTDDKGICDFKDVPIGMRKGTTETIEETRVDIDVSVDGKKPGKASIEKIVEGDNKVSGPIKLDPILPPGELRGVVRALPAGKPVQGATVTITPGDQKVETTADGTFTLALPPGQYKMTVKAAGLAQQELDLVIDPQGVAIKNIDLHK